MANKPVRIGTKVIHRARVYKYAALAIGECVAGQAIEFDTLLDAANQFRLNDDGGEDIKIAELESALVVLLTGLGLAN